MEPCVICAALAGTAPGGLLFGTPLVAVVHALPLADAPARLLGHLLVVPRRHAAALEDLTDGEAAALGVAAAHGARALRAELDLERVYSAVVGHRTAHLHLHLIPRYRGTPADLAWHAADAWDGAPLGGETEIAAVVARLRAAARLR
jgi:diadenosine tetraphosphate (Ap4A) HIT family hydrolase